MLRPGGMLLMYEPNRQYLMEPIRKLWYRFDRFFEAETERALSHDEIFSLACHQFAAIECTYLGGGAYFLIFNSLIFRIPLGIKMSFVRPLFFLEEVYNRLPWKYCFPSFIAQWQRK